MPASPSPFSLSWTRQLFQQRHVPRQPPIARLQGQGRPGGVQSFRQPPGVVEGYGPQVMGQALPQASAWQI